MAVVYAVCRGPKRHYVVHDCYFWNWIVQSWDTHVPLKSCGMYLYALLSELQEQEPLEESQWSYYTVPTRSKLPLEFLLGLLVIPTSLLH